MSNLMNNFFVMSNTRGHKYKLYKTHSTGVRASFFCEGVMNIWNKLPGGVNFSSVKALSF